MSSVRIFFSGDVMTGRGIDQILAHPGSPALYESWARSALRYVELAEKEEGAIPRLVRPDYVWGDALPLLETAGVDARIINLETAVTDRGEPWPAKGIHYRMHPGNVDLLRVADIDCCVMANNHVLDWSYDGLVQTLDTLSHVGIAAVGAGSDIDEARAPATIETGADTRVVVTAFGVGSSGIPASWSAGEKRPGVSMIRSLSDRWAETIASQLTQSSRQGDVTVVSIHWGPNWGYDVPSIHRRFAHTLIDVAGVDVVHGHSSHHPLGIEVYRNRLILYGCGDLINDYEGIGGHEEFRPGLGILYVVTIEPGRLRGLEMIPVRLNRFRLEQARIDDVGWLGRTLSRVSRPFGTSVNETGDGRLRAVW